MKLIYFVIHNTHNLDHVVNSLNSLKDQTSLFVWDELVIKNTIQDQIPNSIINNYLHVNNFTKIFSKVNFVTSEGPSTTYFDLKSAVEYAKNKNASFTLFTKAEYCYSKNYNKYLIKLISSSLKDFVLTPPIVNVTEICTIEDIKNKLSEEEFIKCDKITGYDGNDHHKLKKTNFINRLLIKFKLKKFNNQDIQNPILANNVKYSFISHHVTLDINVHFIDQYALKKMDFTENELNLSWGRIRTFDRLKDTKTHFILTNKCFSLHLFHEIPGKRLGRNINGVRY